MDDDMHGDDASDDEGMGGATFEEFYRDQRFAYMHAQPDSLLQALVSVANKEMVTFGVTMAVEGAVVTGLVVGRDEWLNELAADVDRGSPNGLAFSHVFRTLALDGQLAAALEAQDHEDAPVPPPAPGPLFVHLRNATLWSGGSVVLDEASLRFRLAHVSGWSLLQPSM